MTQIKIYALIDNSTNRPFYVGKTNNTNRRFKEHINESKRMANKAVTKEAYIRHAIAAGVEITIHTLEVVDNAETKIAEMFWINLFKHLGLTNVEYM